MDGFLDGSIGVDEVDPSIINEEEVENVFNEIQDLIDHTD